MIPVCFPFTFIAEETAEAFYRRFGRIVVYQPITGQAPVSMAGLADRGVIEIRCPAVGDESRLTQLYRAFTDWGAMHGKDAAWLKSLSLKDFYNQAFAVEIRSEILKFGETEAREEPDPILNARLFLQLAQEYDLRESEIVQDIQSADMAAENLFEQLKGEAGAAVGDRIAGPRAAGDDAGSHMPETRMAAWSTLARCDAGDPAVFLTHSPAVMDQVAEAFPSLTLLDTREGLPEADLVTAVGRNAGGNGNSGGSDAISSAFAAMDWSEGDGYALEIYSIADCDPDTFLTILSESDPGGESHCAPGHRTYLFCLRRRRG